MTSSGSRCRDIKFRKLPLRGLKTNPSLAAFAPCSMPLHPPIVLPCVTHETSGADWMLAWDCSAPQSGKCLGTPLPSVREDGEQNSSPEAQPMTSPSVKNTWRSAGFCWAGATCDWHGAATTLDCWGTVYREMDVKQRWLSEHVLSSTCSEREQARRSSAPLGPGAGVETSRDQSWKRCFIVRHNTVVDGCVLTVKLHHCCVAFVLRNTFEFIMHAL